MRIHELNNNHPDWTILFSNQSTKFLRKLNKLLCAKLIEKIDYAFNNKRSLIPLKGKPKKHKIRFNDIRVVLIINKKIKETKIMVIDYRDKAYKR